MQKAVYISPNWDQAPPPLRDAMPRVILVAEVHDMLQRRVPEETIFAELQMHETSRERTAQMIEWARAIVVAQEARGRRQKGFHGWNAERRVTHEQQPQTGSATETAMAQNFDTELGALRRLGIKEQFWAAWSNREIEAVRGSIGKVRTVLKRGELGRFLTRTMVLGTLKNIATSVLEHHAHGSLKSLCEEVLAPHRPLGIKPMSRLCNHVEYALRDAIRWQEAETDDLQRQFAEGVLHLFFNEDRREEALNLVEILLPHLRERPMGYLSLFHLARMYLAMLKLDEAEAAAKEMLRGWNAENILFVRTERARELYYGYWDDARRAHAENMLFVSKAERARGLYYGSPVQLMWPKKIRGIVGEIRGLEVREPYGFWGSARYEPEVDYRVLVGSDIYYVQRENISMIYVVIQVRLHPVGEESWHIAGVTMSGDAIRDFLVAQSELTAATVRRMIARNVGRPISAIKIVLPGGGCLDDGPDGDAVLRQCAQGASRDSVGHPA